MNKLAVSRGKETSADSHMTGIEGSPLPGTDKTMDPLGNQVPNIISDMGKGLLQISASGISTNPSSLIRSHRCP